MLYSLNEKKSKKIELCEDKIHQNLKGNKKTY